MNRASSVLCCDYCGADTSNGLALCQACRAWFLVNLEFIPIYFRNLSRWRPSSAASDRRAAKSQSLIDTMVGILETGQTRQAGRPSSLSVAASSDRIGRIVSESHADMTGWARALADDRPQLVRVIDRILTFEEEPSVRLVCALLTKYVDSLTTLPWVRDIVTGVGEIEKRLRTETERSVPGWYAGACSRCASPTYVVPGLTWVTCLRCGVTTHAGDHLETILDEARGWVARPMRIAEALVALVDTEHSVTRLYERIHKWGSRGKITPVRHTQRAHVFDIDLETIVVTELEVGHARYRFGEVLDVLLAEDAVRRVAVKVS